MVQVSDLSFGDVRAHVRSDRHPDLGNEIAKALVSNEALLSVLRGLNVRLGHLDEIVLNNAAVADCYTLWGGYGHLPGPLRQQRDRFAAPAFAGAQHRGARVTSG